MVAQSPIESKECTLIETITPVPHNFPKPDPLVTVQSDFDSLEWLRTTIEYKLRNERRSDETGENHFRRIFIAAVTGDVGGLGALLIEQLALYAQSDPELRFKIWDNNKTQLIKDSNGTWQNVRPILPLDKIVAHEAFINTDYDFVNFLFENWGEFDTTDINSEDEPFLDWLSAVGFC